MRSKCIRMGLESDDDEQQKNQWSSSSAKLPIPKDLPNIEDQLRVLAGAIDKKLVEYHKLIKSKPKAGAKFV